MDFKEFHNLKGITEKDHEPGDAGILIHEGPPLFKDIDLGKTRAEITQALTNLLPGLEASIINEYTNRAIELQLNKSQLRDFAERAKSGALKLESIDTSAVSSNKETNLETADSFIPQVETPTSKPQTNPTNKKDIKGLANDGREIE